MPTFANKMQLRYAQFPSAVDATEVKNWTYRARLDEKSTDFFVPLLQNHDSLVLEYDVTQTLLAKKLQSSFDLSTCEEELVTALMLAETLQHHYHHYLVVPREADYYRQQCQVLKQLLEPLGYTFPDADTADDEFKEHHISKTIGSNTARYNVVRQGVQRSRRFILETGRYLDMAAMQSTLQKIDKIAAPTINYLAFLFFLPRTINNLTMLGKHVIPGPWMSDKERSLGLINRTSFQLNRRGFELMDDLVWFVVNGSLCVVLLGPLSQLVLPMLIAQQTYEALARVVKTLVKVQPMLTMRNHYLKMLENTDISELERQRLKTYLAQLDKRIDHEIKLLCLNTLNSSTILITTIIAISLISVHPLIPVLAAGMAVVATGLFLGIQQWINKHHPDKQQTLSNTLDKQGFFAPSAQNAQTPEYTDSATKIKTNAI